MSKIKFISIGYLIVVFSLFLYSFTQVDLSLTLSRFSVWQVIQKFFQNIGYFNRPLSTLFYILIITFLYGFYFLFLFLAHKKRITKKQIWIIILISSIILTFSYNAFSYDLFNYIFDAKIITYYHQSPYNHAALNYPNDPMLSFMQWTHRYSPYGPSWFVLTVPLSFLGFQLFLPTFFLFKILAAISFIGTVFYIGKITKKIFAGNEVFSMVFFGLNPLIIIESLVSAHNDIVMILFLLTSFYMLLDKKYFRSSLLFIFSVGVKFASILLTPVFLIILILQKKNKKIPWDQILFLSLFLMGFAVIVASFRTNFQPWYLLYFLSFAAICGKNYLVLIFSTLMSFFALLQYIPFLYLGNWNNPVPTILFWLTVIPVVLSFFFTIIFFLRLRKSDKIKTV